MNTFDVVNLEAVQSGIATEHAYDLVTNFDDYASFDVYSDRIARELKAAAFLGSPSRYEEIESPAYVTVGDKHRRKANTTHPPTIEEVFQRSHLETGFDVTNLRAFNLRSVVTQDYTRVVEFSFLAMADLVPKGEAEPTTLGIVRATHDFVQYRHEVKRTIDKAVQVTPTIHSLYPRSVPEQL